jgi:hypothetical protein
MEQSSSQPFEIRFAVPDDASALAELLGDLGYPAGPSELPLVVPHEHRGRRYVRTLS